MEDRDQLQRERDANRETIERLTGELDAHQASQVQLASLTLAQQKQLGGMREERDALKAEVENMRRAYSEIVAEHNQAIENEAAALARVAELDAKLELKDSGLLVRAVETAHSRAEQAEARIAELEAELEDFCEGEGVAKAMNERARWLAEKMVAEARIEAALSAHREGCLCSSCSILRSDPQPDEAHPDNQIVDRLVTERQRTIEAINSEPDPRDAEIVRLRKGLEQMDWVYDAAGCTTGDCPHNDIHDCARALAQRLKEAQDEARALLDSGKGGG